MKAPAIDRRNSLPDISMRDVAFATSLWRPRNHPVSPNRRRPAMIEFWIGSMTPLVAAVAATCMLKATAVLMDVIDRAYRRCRELSMPVPLRRRF
jgi:hypothetical protein